MKNRCDILNTESTQRSLLYVVLLTPDKGDACAIFALIGQTTIFAYSDFFLFDRTV
jgi:hypothetical protein